MIILIYLVLCFIAGSIASKKGKSAVGYFFLSLLLSPLVGIICALITTKNEANMEKMKLEDVQNRKCPFCAEIIKAEAKICKFCHKDLPTIEKPIDINTEILIRNGMWECKDCHTEMLIAGNYCSKCRKHKTIVAIRK